MHRVHKANTMQFHIWQSALIILEKQYIKYISKNTSKYAQLLYMILTYTVHVSFYIFF